MRFDFNEANILNQTYFDGCSRVILRSRFENILSNTKEPILRKSVQSLMDKVNKLSDEELKLIASDIRNKTFIVTSYYKVPHK